MTYEKPVVIDLTKRSEIGFGSGCSEGSGETRYCLNGPTAGLGCAEGTTFTDNDKYED